MGSALAGLSIVLALIKLRLKTSLYFKNAVGEDLLEECFSPEIGATKDGRTLTPMKEGGRPRDSGMNLLKGEKKKMWRRGLILAKASAMRISIPLDLSSRPFIPLPRFMRSRRTATLLAPSLVFTPRRFA